MQNASTKAENRRERKTRWRLVESGKKWQNKGESKFSPNDNGPMDQWTIVRLVATGTIMEKHQSYPHHTGSLQSTVQESSS